jgi:transcriptional regulator with XRE-family HTH domain
MKNDLGEIFLLALNYFYKKYKAKGGTQNKMADRLGITQSYISAVLNGSKKASLELQNQLANILPNSAIMWLTTSALKRIWFKVVRNLRILS